MVWISNRSSETIKVVITSPGGDPGTYEITPEPLLVESWRQNNWVRKTPETATVTFERRGVQFKTVVNPTDVLLVYNDTYIVQPNCCFRLTSFNGSNRNARRSSPGG